MINYSLGIIAGYASAKWMTPRVKSLKTKRMHIHHWIWATALLASMAFIKPHEVIIGGLTGAALEGLSYSNWSIKRSDSE